MAEESRARLRILIVEDDATQRRLLQRSLQRAAADAAEILTAGDVTEAQRVPGPLDLIVSDFTLPERGTALDVQRAWPAVPMIVISGYDRPPGHIGPWIQKPFAPERLMGEIARVLKGWPT